MNHPTPTTATTNTTVFEVIGKAGNGPDAYYFIEVPSEQSKAFQEVLKRGRFNLEEYGTIIVSGYGREAPEAVRKYIIEGNFAFARAAAEPPRRACPRWTD